ncbi:MAG: MFS transporter [Candidatus Thorarchaeota archaeon]
MLQNTSIFFLKAENLFGIHNSSSPLRNLMRKYSFFSLSYQFLFLFSDTFLMFYVLQYVKFSQFGILIAIMYLVQTLTDYPSGNLGDYIGQRWVIAIAFFLFCQAYTLLLFSSSFIQFVLIYVLLALAQSQYSGTLQSWFDNNYNSINNEKFYQNSIYKTFIGRITIWTRIIGSISILIGGLIAFLLFRQIVFSLQIIGYFLLTLLAIKLLKDLPSHVVSKASHKSIRLVFIEGIKFIFIKKEITIYVLGYIIFGTIWTIWSQLILIPLYYGYTGNDFLASLFRFAAWIVSLILANIGIRKASIVSEYSLIPRYRLVTTFLIFGGFAILFSFFSFETGVFNIIGISLTLLIFLIFPIWDLSSDLLEKELFLHVIPNELRTSIYSLLPSLVTIVGIPSIIISGIIIENYGFVCIMLILLISGLMSIIFQEMGLRLMNKLIKIKIS